MFKQIIPNGFCLSCQGCCRFAQAESPWSPAILNSELRKLLKNKLPPSLITPGLKVRLTQQAGTGSFFCSFFSAEAHKCAIYQLRPFECKLYPLLLSRKGKKIYLAVDLNCPFAKDNLEQKAFKEYVKHVKAVLTSPKARALLKKNPQVMQEYCDCVNLAELKI